MIEPGQEAPATDACHCGSVPIVDDIRVLVVDDQASFRGAVAELVAGTPGFRLVGEAADGAAAQASRRDVDPDLVLLDINLGSESGIDLARDLVATDTSLRIVLMSTYAADDLPAGAATCGALGYVHKESLSPSVLAGLGTGSGSGWDR